MNHATVANFNLQVACLEEEIDIFEKQMANVGINIVPYETSNPCFSTELFDMTRHEAGVANLQSEWWSGNPEENFQGYFNSSMIDRLLEELNQDYYDLQSLWMKYDAAPLC